MSVHYDVPAGQSLLIEGPCSARVWANATEPVVGVIPDPPTPPEAKQTESKKT